ncbi:MAG: phosphoheptose isomerase [Candidatus Aminicenantes bacterium RBG_13_63_10]|nr:MAG: phosphoheptose isomerase [Candidatus Aminicenantes bacterium RBG_13_63_10]
MNSRNDAAELSRCLENFLADRGTALDEVLAVMVRAIRAGRKILVFGNGGSAAESQHFAAELVNKYQRLGQALPAVSLTTDTSALTAIANDLSFDRVFSRQVEALGREGDVALALSTSGRSPNIIEGLKAARQKKMTTVALTGAGGGPLAAWADHLLEVDSGSTPRVQEVHLFVLHALAEGLETAFP